MKKNVLTTVAILFIFYSLKADIIPNPIRARGIMPFEVTDVKMIYEKVIVDLYKDSSHVS